MHDLKNEKMLEAINGLLTTLKSILRGGLDSFSLYEEVRVLINCLEGISEDDPEILDTETVKRYDGLLREELDRGADFSEAKMRTVVKKASKLFFGAAQSRVDRLYSKK